MKPLGELPVGCLFELWGATWLLAEDPAWSKGELAAVFVARGRADSGWPEFGDGFASASLWPGHPVDPVGSMAVPYTDPGELHD